MRPLLCVLVLLAACRINTVDPTPLAGPVPGSVVVAPTVNLTTDLSTERGVLNGIDTALRRRGYRVLPVDTGLALLRQHGLERAAMLLAPGLPEIHRFLDVEAVLTLTVRSWEPVYVGGELQSLGYELEYRLTSTMLATQLWQHRMEGRYLRPSQQPVDPLEVRNPELETVPIGIDDQRLHFRSEWELAIALHQTAFLHLPEK